MLLHTLGALFTFPFNSWLGQSWHLWAFWYQLPRVLQLPLDFLKLLHPFRWLHPYGVFPPNNSPGVKVTLLVEGTWDRENWQELPLHYSPSNAKSPPRFVAPHHPRGDQAVIYDTFGLNPQSLISSLVGPWDPYPFGSKSAAVAFLQRIVEGKTLGFVGRETFDKNGGPPVAARLTTVMLEPTSVAEKNATGRWWKRTYIGPHVPPREFDPNFWDENLPEPELWHFDAIFWRRRSRVAPLMRRAATGKEDPLKLAIVDAKGFTAEDLERFWTDCAPLISAPRRETFDTLPDTVAELRGKFDRRTQRAFHRIWARLSMLLVARFEPLYLGKGFSPSIPAKTYFELWMVAAHVIGDGKEAYLSVFSNPMSAAEYLPKLTAQSGLYALSLFRFEEMTFEAQKLRLLQAFLYPHDEKEKLAKSRFETLSKAEQFFFRVSLGVSGFFAVILTIRDAGFKGPRFDHGYPELYPKFEELDSGAVVVQTYTAPPPGVSVPVADTSPAE